MRARALAIVAAFAAAAAAAQAAAAAAAPYPGLAFDEKILRIENFADEAEGRRTGAGGETLAVKAQKLSEADARKLLKNRLAQLRLLFEPQTAPYPGMLTKQQGCAKTAKLARGVTENKSAFYWFSEMPATEDFAYGACGSRTEPLFSHYLLIYCRKHTTLYDIRFFRPRGKQGNEGIGRPIASCAP